jgi:hypothetical protein
MRWVQQVSRGAGASLPDPPARQPARPGAGGDGTDDELDRRTGEGGSEGAVSRLYTATTGSALPAGGKRGWPVRIGRGTRAVATARPGCELLHCPGASTSRATNCPSPSSPASSDGASFQLPTLPAGEASVEAVRAEALQAAAALTRGKEQLKGGEGEAGDGAYAVGGQEGGVGAHHAQLLPAGAPHLDHLRCGSGPRAGVGGWARVGGLLAVSTSASTLGAGLRVWGAGPVDARNTSRAGGEGSQVTAGFEQGSGCLAGGAMHRHGPESGCLLRSCPARLPPPLGYAGGTRGSPAVRRLSRVLRKRAKQRPSPAPTWLLVAVASSGALGCAASAVICPLLCASTVFHTPTSSRRCGVAVAAATPASLLQGWGAGRGGVGRVRLRPQVVVAAVGAARVWQANFLARLASAGPSQWACNHPRCSPSSTPPPPPNKRTQPHTPACHSVRSKGPPT